MIKTRFAVSLHGVHLWGGYPNIRPPVHKGFHCRETIVFKENVTIDKSIVFSFGILGPYVVAYPETRIDITANQSDVTFFSVLTHMILEFFETLFFGGVVYHDNLIFQVFCSMFQDAFDQPNGELLKIVVDDDDGDLQHDPIYKKYLR